MQAHSFSVAYSRLRTAKLSIINYIQTLKQHNWILDTLSNFKQNVTNSLLADFHMTGESHPAFLCGIFKGHGLGILMHESGAVVAEEGFQQIY